MRIWMVEVQTEDRWIPMYQPCYTEAEANAKAVLKRSRLSRSVRVGQYHRVETVEHDPLHETAMWKALAREKG